MKPKNRRRKIVSKIPDLWEFPIPKEILEPFFKKLVKIVKSKNMKREKTYEEKLWDWLIKNFPEKTDARRIFDYVSRLNKQPRRIEFFDGKGGFKKSKWTKP